MRSFTIRVLLVTAAICGLAAAETAAQGNWQPGDFGAIRFRLGILEPAADSQFWDDYFVTFTGSSSDLEDIVFGVDYLWSTSRSSGILFGVSFYEGSTTLSYRDWVDADGGEISHLTTLELSDFSAAYVWRFGRHGARPYLGAGAGLLWWTFREDGRFIDFADPELPVFTTWYFADGLTWEALALAGLDVPLGNQLSFFLEGRYRWAEDELGDDFAGFGTIDLTGYEVAGGLSWNF